MKDKLTKGKLIELFEKQSQAVTEMRQLQMEDESVETIHIIELSKGVSIGIYKNIDYDTVQKLAPTMPLNAVSKPMVQHFIYNIKVIFGGYIEYHSFEITDREHEVLLNRFGSAIARIEKLNKEKLIESGIQELSEMI